MKRRLAVPHPALRDCALIPLGSRQGIAGHALVDASVAGELEKHLWYQREGYAVRGDGSCPQVWMHRVVFGDDAEQVDHINRNKLDNRRCNLRATNYALNAQNVTARGGSSPFRGVTWERDRSKWKAQVRLGDRLYRVGNFVDEIDAALAAQRFRDQNMPAAQPDPELVRRNLIPALAA